MQAVQLSRTHRILVGVVVTGAVVIAAIGFAGSYAAVRALAVAKGFGAFAPFFPIGIDAGIVVLLALDLLLTWIRIPFPLLRQTAWLLTAATIAFNGAAAWPDPLGVGMHAVIPVLFVVSVEAARHAIGRIADITADRHMEGVRVARWLLAFPSTFRLWRRMKLWELRSYDQVIRMEQDRLVYEARLRTRYGRGWRRKAPVEALMPLRLARFGVPLAETGPAGLASAGITTPLRAPLPAAPATGRHGTPPEGGSPGGPQAQGPAAAGYTAAYAGGAAGRTAGTGQAQEPAEAGAGHAAAGRDPRVDDGSSGGRAPGAPQAQHAAVLDGQPASGHPAPADGLAAGGPRGTGGPLDGRTADAPSPDGAGHPTAGAVTDGQPTAAGRQPDHAEAAYAAGAPRAQDAAAAHGGRAGEQSPLSGDGSAAGPAGVTVPVSPGRVRSLGDPGGEPEDDASGSAPVGLPDDVPREDFYFAAYREFAAADGGFPTARQLSRTLYERHGVTQADGSLLSERYLRGYMRELRERYNSEMDMAG